MSDHLKEGLRALAKSLGIRTIREAEREEAEKALRATDGNVDKAAAMVEMGRATLYRRLGQWAEQDRVKVAREHDQQIAAAVAAHEADFGSPMFRIGQRVQCRGRSAVVRAWGDDDHPDTYRVQYGDGGSEWVHASELEG